MRVKSFGHKQEQAQPLTPNQLLGITIAYAVWLLGGIGLVLLFASVSDVLSPYRYLVVAVGLIIALAPPILLRRPTPMFRGERREHRIEGILAILAITLSVIVGVMLGLIMFEQRLAALILMSAIFVGYFVLGASVLCSILLNHRSLFYGSHCRHCLYDLTAVESSTCPECGRSITPPQTEAN